jgi:DNA-binding transcriptional LysR family regulator
VSDQAPLSRLDLNLLVSLDALLTERSVTRAAERLHLSQPALTRSVQAAEAELGLVLFERRGTQVRCTPAGEFVIERARRLVQEGRRLARDAALYRDQQLGQLAFGIGPFAAAALLAPLLHALRAGHPGVRVRVEVQNTDLLAAAVLREELEFFVGDLRAAAGHAALRTEPIGRLRGGFFVRRGHPLLASPAVRLADLLPHGLATARLPPQVQRVVAAAMGLPPEDGLPAAVECDDFHALKTIMLSTDTVMVASPQLLALELATGTAVALAVADIPTVYSELGIVSLQGRIFSPVAQMALAVFRRQATALEPLPDAPTAG